MNRILPFLCTVFFVTPGWTQTPEEKQQTIAVLQSLQAADGGFRPAFGSDSKSLQARSSLRATTAAVRALKYMGGEPKDKKSCAEFADQCFDKTSGGFADYPQGKTDAVTTAVGLMAVVELKLAIKDYSETATAFLNQHARSFEEIRMAAAAMEAIGGRSPKTDAWLAQIAKLRNEDGTYGKGDGIPRATGGAVAAVLRLGAAVEQRDNVVHALKAGQRQDGGFAQEGKPGSDLETSYRITRALHMFKEKPDVDRMRAFIAKCRNNDGGYGVAPGQPSQVGSTYYAAIILHWLEK